MATTASKAAHQRRIRALGRVHVLESDRGILLPRFAQVVDADVDARHLEAASVERAAEPAVAATQVEHAVGVRLDKLLHDGSREMRVNVARPVKGPMVIALLVRPQLIGQRAVGAHRMARLRSARAGAPAYTVHGARPRVATAASPSTAPSPTTTPGQTTARAADPREATDGDGRTHHRKGRVVEVVRRAAEERVLRDDGVGCERDERRVVDHGAVGDADRVLAHEVPGRPNTCARIDVAMRSEARPERAKHHRTPRVERARRPAHQQPVSRGPEQARRAIARGQARREIGIDPPTMLGPWTRRGARGGDGASKGERKVERKRARLAVKCVVDLTLRAASGVAQREPWRPC